VRGWRSLRSILRPDGHPTMDPRELVFASIVLLLVAGLHAYLAWRLFGRGSGLARWRWAGRGALALSALLILVAFPGSRYLPRSGELLSVQYAGFCAMGVVLVLFPLTLARDGLGGVRRALGKLTRAPVEVPASPERRDFLRALSSFGVLGSSSALAGAGALQARQLAEVRRVPVPIAGLHPDLVGLRIAQISDLHLGPILGRAWLDQVVSAVNQLQPDLIAVTGDLVDGHVPDLREDVGALRRLRAPHGVYFVTGNHEYYWDALAWVEEVRRLGLDVLVNEHRELAIGGARLWLAGVTDLSARSHVRRHATDPGRALAGSEASDLRVLLAHQPKSIAAARRLGVDLQLSGHTHGGQFFPWNLVVGLFQPLSQGLGRFGDTWLYVNRGTGTWGPPLRTGVPAEITEIELVRADG
jgi:uncharacterized protein